MNLFSITMVIITIAAPLLNEQPRMESVPEDSATKYVATTNDAPPTGQVNTNSSPSTQALRSQPPSVVNPPASPDQANPVRNPISGLGGLPIKGGGAAPAPGNGATSPMMKPILKTRPAARPMLSRPLNLVRPS